MNIKILGTIVVTMGIAVGAFLYLGQEETGPKPIDPKNVVHKTINMKGMTCEACEIAIDRVIKDKGMVKVKSTSADQRVEVEYDKTQTDIDTIMKNINRKGFTPVSYADEKGLHDVNGSMKTEVKHEMKCGSGKCGGAK
ncbi:MAG: hypothetical protein COA44_09735 [Arcobacter sp.]|nr:MAG: hypothetical protein COA44_09735 [Arcobacter sp.]